MSLPLPALRAHRAAAGRAAGGPAGRRGTLPCLNSHVSAAAAAVSYLWPPAVAVCVYRGRRSMGRPAAAPSAALRPPPGRRY